MADANATEFVLGLLRRVAPAYRFMRTFWRGTRCAGLAFIRKVFAKSEIIGPPLGFFSGLEQLRRGRLKGRIILEGQDLPPASDRSLRSRCGLGQNGHQPWPIFWFHERNARLVGPSLAMRDASKHLLLEACYGKLFAVADPANQTVYLPPATHLEGAWTSVINRWGDTFYHWLTDCLPRLALLSEFPDQTRVLVPARLRPYQIESLQMLGLENRVRPTAETHLLVDDYYFSSTTGMTGCDNYYNIAFLRERLLSFARTSPIPRPRVFIRRRGKTRGMKNEEVVARFFTDLGWYVVDLEQLSLAEQIGLFASAEAVCALHGAALTHLIWCQPECCVLELLASNFLNGCYEGLAACRGLRHSYLVFPGDGHFQVTVDLAAVSTRLREMGL